MATAGELHKPLSACVKHNEGQHFVVLESGRLAYVSLPQEYAAFTENEDLCFADHAPKGVTTDMCCLQESEHVHAHVHHGDIIEDILLEQCMEESGCALPVLRELSGFCHTMLPMVDIDHEHGEGCGHAKIFHGDHVDWLVPLNDGSFLLSHPQVKNGLSSCIEHGRLISRGKTLAKLNLRPKLVDLFSYESPKQKGYTSLPQFDEAEDGHKRDSFQIVKGRVGDDCTIMPSTNMGRNVVQGGMMKVDVPATYVPALCKTTLDVMGICCPSEVPLIKKLLDPLPGVEDVFVNVTAKTVLVSHDQLLVTDIQLVKVLNGAHLDASIHHRGELKSGRSWPSPWCLGSGILVAIAFFHYIYEPLTYVALGAVGVGVPPLILKAIAALRKFVLDINILMLIAVGGAIALGDYLEAGTIVFLFSFAEWLESRSTDKARAAIAAVVDRAPQSATLVDGGMRVRVEEVKVGTLLSVKMGDTIPIDGEVVSGRGFVDESSLTGESIPVEKELGATVWAGTINVSGYLAMKTTALSVDSAVARMVRLVEEAQSQRSKTEMLVEKIAKYYTPAVVFAAAIIGVVPWAAGVNNPKHWVYLALVLLVVACPCALVISTPVVVTCGLAQAARLGLLVKGGTYLEILGRLKVVALDKTGTLSEGQFCVSNVLSINGVSTLQQVLYWVMSVENKASHPLASALVGYARLKGVEPSEDVIDFEMIAGEGVSAVVDGHTVQIGNERMATRLGWDSGFAVETLASWSSSGETVGWVGLDGIAIGIFSVGDQLRSEAAEAVRGLKNLGIRVAMLTGDSSTAAAHVHGKIGEIDVFAELLPEDKVRIVQELKEHGIIAMVGDGINDAPALAAADLGIAMGVAGSAVAMETADVALMTNDLRKLPAAVRLGVDCRWKIGQNVTVSFVTKLLIIGLAAGGYASLWAAVLADVGTCLAVVFNSMRILKKAKRHGGQDQCISEKLEMDSKKNSHSGCCEKGEVVIDCSEENATESGMLQAPAVSHKHHHHHHHHHGFRVRLPWLPKHRHHHHHQDKKEKCEEDALCCADKEDQPPCCSSARCKTKVLTSRGKGHRHGTNVGVFDKTKGVRKSIDLCERSCCNDAPPAPIVQPKPTGCGSSRKCCLPEEKSVQKVELTQKSRTADADAQCCSKESCNDLASCVLDDSILKNGTVCCSEDTCRPSEACSPISAGCSSSVEKEPASGCCSNGSCKAPVNKKEPASGCCSNGSCKAPLNKKEPTSGCCSNGSCKVPVNKKEPASGCCSNGSCKAPLSKEEPASGCCSNGSCKAPLNKEEPASGCCSNGSCKAPVNKKEPTSGCCSNGSCNAPLNKEEPASGCCSNGSCKVPVNKKEPASGCCSNGSCKAPLNKKTPSPATETRKDSDASASNGPSAGKAAVGCGAGDCCKSSECEAKTSPGNVLVTDSSAGNEDLSTSTDSCCADPSSCKSCVVPTARQV